MTEATGDVLFDLRSQPDGEAYNAEDGMTYLAASGTILSQLGLNPLTLPKGAPTRLRLTIEVDGDESDAFVLTRVTDPDGDNEYETKAWEGQPIVGGTSKEGGMTLSHRNPFDFKLDEDCTIRSFIVEAMGC